VTGAGLYFLDIIDHFVINFVILGVGILECIAVGWVFGAHKIREYFNSVSSFKIGRWWEISIKYITPTVLITIFVLQIINEIKTPYGGFPLWAILVGVGAVLVPLIISFLIPQKKVEMPA